MTYVSDSYNEHTTYKCKHGMQISTCRCPSANKSIIIMPCPATCPDKQEGDDDYSYSGDREFLKQLARNLLEKDISEYLAEQCRRILEK